MPDAQNIETKSPKVLQAFLDMFTYPVWIADVDGGVLLNHAARDLVSSGFSIARVQNLKESTSINHKGRKLVFRKQDMNHGTDCFLNELRDEDEPLRRMRESSEHLNTILDRYKS